MLFAETAKVMLAVLKVGVQLTESGGHLGKALTCLQKHLQKSSDPARISSGFRFSHVSKALPGLQYQCPGDLGPT